MTETGGSFPSPSHSPLPAKETILLLDFTLLKCNIILLGSAFAALKGIDSFLHTPIRGKALQTEGRAPAALVATQDVTLDLIVRGNVSPNSVLKALV